MDGTVQYRIKGGEQFILNNLGVDGESRTYDREYHAERQDSQGHDGHSVHRVRGILEEQAGERLCQETDRNGNTQDEQGTPAGDHVHDIQRAFAVLFTDADTVQHPLYCKHSEGQ